MAWKVPAAHQAAFHTAMAQHLAPIDKPASTGTRSSMAQGINTEHGVASGALEPGSTPATVPVGAASPIRMKVNPHLKRGSVPHTLVGSMLK